MSELTTYTSTNAPEGSQPLLAAAEKEFGFVPNLLGVFAESPATLEAYLKLDSLFNQSSFSKRERQIILLIISRYADCCYCLAAHGTLAKALKIDQQTLNAINFQTPLDDPKLEALRGFIVSMLDHRGWVDKTAIEAFYQAGFERRQVLEIVLAISFKSLSNYVNHINDTEIDSRFINGLPNQTAGQQQATHACA